MNDTFKISVIIPIYNAEKYLHRCIDSILSQSYYNLEILLINDGSKDASGNICNQYAIKDRRVKVFHKENAGASSARNTGLDNCTGGWVSFVDADDYLLPDTFRKGMFEQLRGVHYDVIEFPFERGQLGRTTYKVGSYSRNKYEAFYTNQFHNELWGRLFLRESIGTHRFNSRVIIGEDVLFLIEVLSSCKAMYCFDNGGYYYNISSDSLMRGSDEAFLEEQRYALLDALEQRGLLDNKIAIAFYFRLKEVLQKNDQQFCDFLKSKKVTTIMNLLLSSFTLKKKIKYLLAYLK